MSKMVVENENCWKPCDYFLSPTLAHDGYISAFQNMTERLEFPKYNALSLQT